MHLYTPALFKLFLFQLNNNTHIQTVPKLACNNSVTENKITSLYTLTRPQRSVVGPN